MISGEEAATCGEYPCAFLRSAQQLKRIGNQQRKTSVLLKILSTTRKFKTANSSTRNSTSALQDVKWASRQLEAVYRNIISTEAETVE